jgi:predicted RNase H-like HicB family nuclease
MPLKKSSTGGAVMSKVQTEPRDYLRAPYSRVLIPDDESGTYTARILEFPGCVAQGDSVAEAYECLERAAEDWIVAAVDLGQEIPAPTEEQTYSGRVLLRLPKSLHKRAAELAYQDSTSLNQFIVAAVAEKVGATNVVATLASRLDRVAPSL